ncbi:hypothetical protein ES705_23817 [subsurface metagenome]
MYFERKTAKCPVCGDVVEMTPWKPPRGLDQQLREYRCARHTCRKVFYMCGIYYTSSVKLSD